MRIASINLNRRLGSDVPRKRLEGWLAGHEIDLLLAQEAWTQTHADAPLISSFMSLGGTALVHAWIVNRCALAHQVELLGPKWLRLDVAGLVVHVVYLDATSSARRARELEALLAHMARETSSDLMVVGDFNLAPSAADGLYGDRPSGFNSETDRAPFRRLLAGVGLVDLGAVARGPSFTFERMRGGRRSAFRCDLILASISLAPELTLSSDHSTRDPTSGFTDHSGLVIDVPRLSISGRSQQ
jgi:exonuclease III